jgi:hypothetical protein
MRLFAIMLKGRLLDEIESRISDLSEPQLDAWLKGHISLVDAVLERHGNALLEHRELALEVIEVLTIEDLRERLMRARPELSGMWDSPDFPRAFDREVRRLRDFLGPPIEERQGEVAEGGL